MAQLYSDAVRNDRANVIKTHRDAGASAGFTRYYVAPRPTTVGPVTAQLGETTFSPVSSPDAVAGVLSASAISPDAGADASGVADWYAEFDGDGVMILHGKLGLTGDVTADATVNDLNFVIGLPINVLHNVHTEGNAP